MPIRDVVIVGAGQAGFQTAASLRQDGFDGRIFLIGDEPLLPYQRPPLSKAYLKDREGRADRLVFRKEDFFAKNRIDLLVGERVTRLERAERRVVLQGGARWATITLCLQPGRATGRCPVLTECRIFNCGRRRMP
jgi:3-phenylpropionate/trans-cinnamate dioxygenase ferredoxin reductase component